ncbi:MAG: hypothetical protein Q9M39_03940 [Sulfurovum sp.]|nr:hypothetical protein [Sulfurovum sp.]
MDDGISSIYCYYDPQYPRYSLGTYSLLYEIKLAEMLGLEWVYLGHWIEGYKAFEYKEKFQPIEILEGYPRASEKPDWKPWVSSKNIREPLAHSLIFLPTLKIVYQAVPVYLALFLLL